MFKFIRTNFQKNKLYKMVIFKLFKNNKLKKNLICYQNINN